MTVSPRFRQAASLCGVTILYLLLTLWFTAPQLERMDRVIPHQDPLLTIWRLAWIAHQVPRDPLHLLNANILHPLRGTAAFSDAFPLLGSIAAPFLWLGVPAVVTYNILLLGAFVTAALGAFLLVRELTGSAIAAFVAGVVFAFSPFRFDHYWHLEILWSAWIPLTLWALHRTIATNRWTFGILTGLGIAAQAFSCIYLAIFLAAWLAIVGVLLVACRLLDLRSRATRALLAGAILGAALVAPYGRAYSEGARVVGTRSTEETQTYSGEVHSYLASPPSNRLYGWTAERWGGPEKQLFPGVTVVVLALIGLWPPWTRLRLIYAAATILAFDLSLGLNGVTFGPLRQVVGIFEGLRAPARAATLVHLGLAVLAGYGLARLGRLGARPPDAARGVDVTLGASQPSGGEANGPAAARWLLPAAGALVTALLIVEYTNHPLPVHFQLETRAPVLAQWFAKPEQEGAVLIELPVPRADRLPGEDARYQFISTFHWRKLVNGYTSFAPPRYLRLMELMTTFPDETSIGAIRSRGATHLVVHPVLYPGDEGHALVERLRTLPDFAFVGWLPDGWSTDARNMAAVFRIVPR